MIPTLSVGILEAKNITVAHDGHIYRLLPTANGLTINDQPDTRFTLAIAPGRPPFTIRDVEIGIGFHWQKHEDQSFIGSLKVIPSANGLLAINIIDIESYLHSVISSEMNPLAPQEFLKAHSVISRSWALAQIRNNRKDEAMTPQQPSGGDDDEIIRWYDHSSHEAFDVCADDHCQRYQGIAKANRRAAEAVAATSGEVLTYGSELCDARFSKCCGGATELFSTCWQPVDPPYLQAIRDTDAASPADFSDESRASAWISSSPDAFCANPSPEILASILNDYDRRTPHLYRWTVEYSREQLAGIVRSRTGHDFGDIVDLRPLHRGPSARIDRLAIVGTKKTLVIGKELEIRRSLSPSHLYSSAFIARGLNRDAHGIPANWVITGAGWGHGVGLCQIGAAVMASKGYDYRRILSHYFPGATISKIY